MTACATAKRRITIVGLAVNLPLAAIKITAGTLASSPALVADGVHSVADVGSDAAVLWALGHSARAPDHDHPWGHGRFETLATLVLAALVALTAAGIAWDSVRRLFAQGMPDAPGALALWVVLGAILVKEALYHATRAVGRRADSALIMANAWHHRSDALSSVVALAGIAAALAGWPLADPLAAGMIAVLLLRVAWRFGRPAVRELVDTQPPEAMRRALDRTLADSPGVHGLRALRMRQHGAQVVADVSILVDPEISVTEAHRIAEATRSVALARHPALEDIVIHIEPDAHHSGFGAHDAPLRSELEARIQAQVARWPAIQTLHTLRLDYFDEGLRVELVVSLDRSCDQLQLEAELKRAIAADLSAPLIALRLLSAAPRHPERN